MQIVTMRQRSYNRTAHKTKPQNRFSGSGRGAIALFAGAFAILLALTILVGTAIMPLIEWATGGTIAEVALHNCVPAIASHDEDFVAPVSAGSLPSVLSKFFLGFDVRDPITLMNTQITALAVWHADSEYTSAVATAAQPDSTSPSTLALVTPTESIPENTAPILALDLHPTDSSGYLSSDGVMIKNSTAYTIDTAKLLAEQLNFNLSGSGPKVLIIHTHTSEAFLPTDTNYYNPSDPNRTEDQHYNVVRVGEEMAAVLNDMGVETLHDKTSNDYPSYNGSYKKSLQTVEWYLKQYPSIQIVLDIHRDAMTRSDNTRLKGVTTIDGRKAAQIMIVVGTDSSGLNHPNWRENLKFAAKLQKSMNDLYPSLTRAIDLRTERFNMHMTTGSLILEVGSTGNTLEEAILGGKGAAKALGTLLNSL